MTGSTARGVVMRLLDEGSLSTVRFRHTCSVAFARIWCLLHCVSIFQAFYLRGNAIFCSDMPKRQRLQSVPFIQFPMPASRNCDRFSPAASCLQLGMLPSTCFYSWCNPLHKSLPTQTATDCGWSIRMSFVDPLCPLCRLPLAFGSLWNGSHSHDRFDNNVSNVTWRMCASVGEDVSGIAWCMCASAREDVRRYRNMVYLCNCKISNVAWRMDASVIERYCPTQPQPTQYNLNNIITIRFCFRSRSWNYPLVN